jgi:hypothetical protein
LVVYIHCVCIQLYMAAFTERLLEIKGRLKPSSFIEQEVVGIENWLADKQVLMADIGLTDTIGALFDMHMQRLKGDNEGYQLQTTSSVLYPEHSDDQLFKSIQFTGFSELRNLPDTTEHELSRAIKTHKARLEYRIDGSNSEGCVGIGFRISEDDIQISCLCDRNNPTTIPLKDRTILGRLSRDNESVKKAIYVAIDDIRERELDCCTFLRLTR